MDHITQPSGPQVGHHRYRIIYVMAILDMACCLRLKNLCPYSQVKKQPTLFWRMDPVTVINSF